MKRGETTGRCGAGRLLAAALMLMWASGCGSVTEFSPAEQPLAKPTLMLLSRKGLETHTPLFIRIFKEEAEFEVWKATPAGTFVLFQTYPICARSGELGPKFKEGDKQAPEGFYEVRLESLNPRSQLYLSFDLGYPNAFDRAHGRNGSALMVHGQCTSAGCYAMTDALIEEIYALLREAFRGGQLTVAVHAFPFRMNEANMARYRGNVHYPFWSVLKQGYDAFEVARLPPAVVVCEKRYLISPRWRGEAPFDIDARSRCPPHDVVPAHARLIAPFDGAPAGASAAVKK